MAESDVRLEAGGWLDLDGDQIRCSATDFHLDAASRRGTEGQGRPRRALVHEVGDRLVINFEGDYPGGVCLQGGGLFLEGLRKYNPDGTPAEWVALQVLDKTETMKHLAAPTLVPVFTVDLLAEINNLRWQVAMLCKKAGIAPMIDGEPIP
jgi:hypothetical protein